MPNRIDTTLGGTPRERAAGARPIRHRRFPRYSHFRIAGARPAGVRRRYARNRRAFQRPARRRPHRADVELPRAPERSYPVQVHRDCEESPRRRSRSAPHLDGILQPIPPLRPRKIPGRFRHRRGGRPDSSRPTDRGGRAAIGNGRGARYPPHPLLAPTSSDERIRDACESAGGFIYCVNFTGVTGARRSSSQSTPGLVERIRRYTDLPILVGFGVSRREHIEEIATYADGP